MIKKDGDKLAGTMGWPDQDDRDAWPRLRELIASAVAARSQSEWTAIFEGTDACVTPVLTSQA